MRGIAVVTGLLLAAGACSDATDVERLEIDATGAVVGQAYLDRNGNGAPGGGDEPMAGVTVVLSPASGGVAASETETDEEGVFIFEDVPVGRYTVSIAADVLADSLVPVADAEPFDVVIDDAAEVSLGATYPALSIDEVREAEPGRRVFTTGIALNARQSFSDGRVFLGSLLEGGPAQDQNAHLQATGVARSSPAVNVGDSVRFLGTTSSQFGQPTLDDVTPFILVQQAQVPIAVEASTGVAATADDGALDAALVVVRSAVVSDTASVSGDYYFDAEDGSGPVELVLRSFLGFPARPADGDTISARGTLAPFDDGSGVVRWRLLVRSASELAITPGS